jgi:hypothetical protein
MPEHSREFLHERDVRIFQAARNGIPRSTIAKQFGISTDAVGKAIQRQIGRLNKEALSAAPELIRMELERLDALMAGVWPYTQPTRIQLPDGTAEIVPPDVKYVTEARNNIKDRNKLLGLEQNTVNITVETEPVKSSLAGTAAKGELNAHDPRTEALAMLEIMGRTGILPRDTIEALMGGPEQLAIEAPQPVESKAEEIPPLAEILEGLGPEEEDA